MNNAIAEQRLHNQYISRAAQRRPADVVAWLGALQAQEYPAARWGLGLRMPDGTSDAAIERACDEGRILRTHVMRPTWHFVAPADIRWMLELTAPRVHRMMAHYNRRLELDRATQIRAASIFERVLGDGRHLTRAELGVQLARARLVAKGTRLALLTMYAELEGVMCSGRRQTKQLTYALIAERAPKARRLSRDEALAELTSRFFKSHGPATIRDFVWWSGLTSADTKRGLEMIGARYETVDDCKYWSVGRTMGRVARRKEVHLLPVYDEYFVAYRDREAVPHGTASGGAGGPMLFQNPLIIGGQAAGTWRASRRTDGVTLDVLPMRKLTTPERRAIGETAAAYARFLGTQASVSIK